jgi:sulfur carrier protein
MIKINGEYISESSGKNVLTIIEEKGYKLNRIAVEYNGNILPKDKYDNTFLKDGDVLEVVSFVGGG